MSAAVAANMTSDGEAAKGKGEMDVELLLQGAEKLAAV